MKSQWAPLNYHQGSLPYLSSLLWCDPVGARRRRVEALHRRAPRMRRSGRQTKGIPHNPLLERIFCRPGIGCWYRRLARDGRPGRLVICNRASTALSITKTLTRLRRTRCWSTWRRPCEQRLPVNSECRSFDSEFSFCAWQLAMRQNENWQLRTGKSKPSATCDE